MKKKTDTRHPTARSVTRAGGFTLLEVLAAVAILGIWFSVLAGVAIQGLRSEGENERRIRASLLADRVLADIELNLAAGQFPEETDTETEDEEFTIRTSSVPLIELEFAELDAELLLLLENDLAKLAPDLHAIIVSVTWIEGAQEEKVTRLRYAWDSAPLFELLSDPNAAQSGEDSSSGDLQGADEDGEDL